jgi:hypothetical protein
MTSRKSYFSIALGALFFTACASTHPGVVGKTVNSSPDLHLVVSADWNKANSDESNLFLDITVENKSGMWAHIDMVDVEFPTDENITHNVIVGNDLKAWADSTAIRQRKSDYNTSMGIAGLMAAGAILMVAAAASGRGSSNTKGLATAGVLAYGAGATAGIVRSVKSDLNRVERGFTVPESHLLAPITIPSNGFAQKWILINIPAGARKAAEYMRLKIHTVEGGDSIIDIPLMNKHKKSI